MSTLLFGRERELAIIDELLSRPEEGASGLVLVGEPGIGKSALLAAAVARAQARHWCVLACSPGEHETHLAFTGLGDLLEHQAERVAAELPPAQRHALESALLLSDRPGPRADPRALHVAVLAALRILCAERPTLLAIDDVHWLDTESASVLQFALRRLRSERLAVAATWRRETGGTSPLEIPRSLEHVVETHVGPLSVAALFRILRDRLDISLPRPTLLRLHEACGGNPLYALEMGRELLEGSLSLAPGEPIPLPRNRRLLIERRLARLRMSTRQVLAGGASLARPAVEVLEAAFGRSVVERTIAEAARAAVADVVQGELRFAHPLFASASYSMLEPHARRAIHRRLASVLDDPEERARHLALGSIRLSEETAQALELAAERAVARGAVARAAELEELAIEATPQASQATRARRKIRAVELLATAGELARARELGEQLLAELPRGPSRAEAALALTGALEDDLERMTALVDEALGEPGIPDDLRARLLGQAAEARFRRGYAREALDPARRGLEIARCAGETRIMLTLAAHLATAGFWSGEASPGALLDMDGHGALREWVEVERTTDAQLAFADSPRAALATRLVDLGEMEEARALFHETLAEAEARGDERTRARALWHLAQLEDYSGNWRESESLLERAVEVEEQLGLASGAVYFARAGHAAVLGRVEETERLVEEGVSRAREAGDTPYELLTLGVLGFLRFSLGDARGAIEILGPIVERAQEISEPRVNRFWPDTIEALVADGNLALAERYLEFYAAEAERLGVPRSLARVAHCRGVLLAASGRREPALEAFSKALAIHERCPNVFEHARTLLALGTAQRRFKQRRAARESLLESLEVFESLPSPPWADRARAELARTGVRRRSGGLTETEMLVARLAAQGLTNREIGQRAFLTPKSVEDVLRRVYRTVGVRNKTELAGRLAEAAAGPTAPTST